MDPNEVSLLRTRADELYRAGMEAGESEREEEALAAFREAATALQRLLRLKTDEAVHDRRKLVVCLRNLSTLQWMQGRYEEAVASAEQAVEACRAQDLTCPDDRTNLGSCLAALATKLKQLGRHAEVFDAEEEATEMIWSAFLAEPRDWAGEIEDLLHRRLRHYQELGKAAPVSLTERISDFEAALAKHGHPVSDASKAGGASADDPVQRILVAVAKEAVCQKALDRDADVLQWWCQLGELTLSLAWRARGWHIRLAPKRPEDGDGHWLVGLPPQATDTLALRALGLSHGGLAQRLRGAVPNDQLTTVRAAIEGAPQGDAVTRAAHALQRAACADEYTIDSVGEITEELLACLWEVAQEFQDSEPISHDGQYVGELSMMPIPNGPIHPAENEAMRVLGHLVELTTDRFDTVIRV